MSLEDLKEELTKVVDPPCIRSRNYEKDGYFLEVTINGGQVKPVAQAARDADCFLESITGVDWRLHLLSI